jgi:hypothetical protein
MKLHSLIASFILFVCSTSSFAGTWTTKIDKILMYEGGNLVYVYPAGGVPNKPACHGSNGDYVSFSMARPKSKEYLAVLMLAFATNKNVEFTTYGACSDQSVSDTLMYFMIIN